MNHFPPFNTSSNHALLPPPSRPDDPDLVVVGAAELRALRRRARADETATLEALLASWRAVAATANEIVEELEHDVAVRLTAGRRKDGPT